MKFSQSKGVIVKALLSIQQEIQPVVKDAKNPMLNSTYATLAAITDYARPLLAKHEVFMVQSAGDPVEVGGFPLLSMQTRLVHVSGEWVENIVYAPIAEQNSKDGKERKATAQTAGSVITYLRRYGLSSLLALTTDEDDDGNRASKQQKRESRNASRGVMAEANAAGATNVKDFLFPPLKGWEQFRKKPLKDCSLDAIEDAYKRTKDQPDKEAGRINRVMAEELERRRDQSDFEKPHPALAEEAHQNGAR